MTQSGFRMSIDGVDTEWVTDASMAVTGDDGRQRRPGLQVDPDLVIEQDPDVLRVELEAEPISLSVVDDERAFHAGKVFMRRPKTRTWLREDFAVTANTMKVQSTEGLTYAKALYVGKETLRSDGTADRIADTDTGFFSYWRQVISVSSSTQYAASLYVRKDNVTSRRPSLYIYDDGTSYFLTLNTQTGDLDVAGSGTPDSSNVSDVGDYWRLELVFTTGGSTTQVIYYIRPAGHDESGSSSSTTGSIIVFGAQLEQSSSVTGYEKTEGSAGTKNLLPRSEEFDHGDWTTGGSTSVTADAETRPFVEFPSTTTITGIARGQWGSITMGHYNTLADTTLALTPVTSDPMSIRGRRLKLYMYRKGEHSFSDTATDAGALIFRGIISSGARFRGGAYEIKADPITRLLKQELAAGIDNPASPRGIVYATFPKMTVKWDLHDGITPGSVDQSDTVTFPDDASSSFKDSDGNAFFETQEEFCAELSDKLQSSIDSTTANPPTINAVPDLTEGWTIIYEPNATSTKHLKVQVHGPVDGESSGDFSEERGGAPVWDIAAATPYWMIWDPVDIPGARTIPRGYSGYEPTMWIGSGVPLSSDMSQAVIEWQEQPFLDTRVPDDPIHVTPEHTGQLSADVTTSNRRASFGFCKAWHGWYPMPIHAWTRDTLPRVRMLLDYPDAENVAEMLKAITDIAPKEVNRHGVPELFAGDVDNATNTALLARLPGGALLRRDYVFGNPVDFDEWLAHEGRVAGVALRIDSGQLQLFEFTAEPITHPETKTIDVVSWDDSSRPEVSEYDRDLVHTFVLHTGYDPVEDEHKGRTFQVVDSRAYGLDPTGGTIDVEPKSSVDSEGIPDITAEDAASAFMQKLALYGNRYLVVRCAVIDKKGDWLPGDHASLTIPELPDWDTGKRGRGGVGGLQKLPATVVSTRWTPKKARNELELHVTGLDIAGYTPSAGITSQTNVSGDTWDIGVRLGDPLGMTTWDDGSGSIGHFYVAGMQIQLTPWNSSSGTAIGGTIDSVSGSNMRITLDSTWFADKRVLSYRDAASITDSEQKKYAYYSGDDGQIDFSDESVDARELG